MRKSISTLAPGTHAEHDPGERDHPGIRRLDLQGRQVSQGQQRLTRHNSLAYRNVQADDGTIEGCTGRPLNQAPPRRLPGHAAK